MADFKAVSLFIGVIIILVFLVSGRSMADRVLISLLIISLYLIFTGTILARSETGSSHWMLTPFWEYREAFKGDIEFRNMIIENVLLFLPSGGLLGMLYKGQRSWWPIMFLIGFSIVIELAQGFLNIGLCEFDDVFNNSAGAALGFGIVKLIYKLKTKNKEVGTL